MQVIYSPPYMQLYQTVAKRHTDSIVEIVIRSKAFRTIPHMPYYIQQFITRPMVLCFTTGPLIMIICLLSCRFPADAVCSLLNVIGIDAVFTYLFIYLLTFLIQTPIGIVE